MRTRIQWIIERRHRDGAWQATCAAYYWNNVLKRRLFPDLLIGETPGYHVGHPETRLLPLIWGQAAMTSERLASPDFPREVIRELAAEGLPEGLSEAAWLDYKENLRKPYMRSQLPCWFELGQLRHWQAALSVTERDPVFASIGRDLAEWRDAIEDVLAIPEANATILRGPPYSKVEAGYYPRMQDQSAHARLAARAQAAGLLPIADESVRFVLYQLI